jgi:antirestriction protein ArdC
MEQESTDRMLAALAEGTIPWRKTWNGTSGLPANLISGKSYRGWNVFELAFRPFASRYWVTFKQAKETGGSVKRGEKGTQILFWKRTVWNRENKDTGETERVPSFLLRYYTVFNVEQCEGIEHKRLRETARENTPVERDALCEEIVSGYIGGTGPSFECGGNGAFYVPSRDHVQTPKAECFEGMPEYYSTLFHELGHSTGHASRLNRDGVVNPASFRSHRYSKEELIAEMTACFLRAHAGIDDPRTFQNSAAYIDTWRKVISSDKKLVISAAQAAQRASDCILGTRFETEGE